MQQIMKRCKGGRANCFDFTKETWDFMNEGSACVRRHLDN